MFSSETYQVIGLRLVLSLALAVSAAQTQTCRHLTNQIAQSCSTTGNVTSVETYISDYVQRGCIQTASPSQGQLDFLISSSVQLPAALMTKFTQDTNWTIRLSLWDEFSSSLPPLAGARGSVDADNRHRRRRLSLAAAVPATNTRAASPDAADWAQILRLSYDGWILDSQLLPGAGFYGLPTPPARLLDPAAFVDSQRSAQPQIRLYGTSYLYQTAAVPVGADALVLYGHRDALTRLYSDIRMRSRLGLGWEAPQADGALPATTSLAVSAGGRTDDSVSSGSGNSSGAAGASTGEVRLPAIWSWEQLVDAVAAVNGTDFDRDGVVEHGICLDVDPGCLAPALVQSIAASYLQTRGSSQGSLLDPESMRWRLDSPGFRAALWTLQRLLAFAERLPEGSAGSSGDGIGGGGDDGGGPSCRRLSVGFAEGRCAFAIHLTTHLKASHAWPSGDANAVQGTRVMQLPGSTRVDHGALRAMEDCTGSTCPYALPFTSSGSAGGGGWTSLLLAAVQTAGGSSSSGFVNVAPLVFGGPVGAVSAATPALYQSAAARFLSYLASVEAQTQLAADAHSGVMSFRQLNLTDVAAAAPPAQRLNGRQVADLQALQARLWVHPNAAPALRLPGAKRTWPLFETAVEGLRRGLDPFPFPGPNQQPYEDDAPLPYPPSPAVEQAVASLTASLPAALQAVMPDAATFRAQYAASVAYKRLMLSKPVEKPPAGKGSRVALIVGLSVVFGVALLVLLAAGAVRTRRSLRRLRRTASDDTDSSNRRSTATYVVLDIRGLSGPSVPYVVREQGLRMVHDAIKQLVRRYNGSQVQLPEGELLLSEQAPERGPPHALREAFATELASLMGTCDAAGGGGGSTDGHGGGAESGADTRSRPPPWGYESSYLTLAPRDLVLPPPPPLPMTVARSSGAGGAQGVDAAAASDNSGGGAITPPSILSAEGVQGLGHSAEGVQGLGHSGGAAADAAAKGTANLLWPGIARNAFSSQPYDAEERLLPLGGGCGVPLALPRSTFRAVPLNSGNPHVGLISPTATTSGGEALAATIPLAPAPETAPAFDAGGAVLSEASEVVDYPQALAGSNGIGGGGRALTIAVPHDGATVPTVTVTNSGNPAQQSPASQVPTPGSTAPGSGSGGLLTPPFRSVLVPPPVSVAAPFSDHSPIPSLPALLSPSLPPATTASPELCKAKTKESLSAGNLQELLLPLPGGAGAASLSTATAAAEAVPAGPTTAVPSLGAAADFASVYAGIRHRDNQQRQQQRQHDQQQLAVCAAYRTFSADTVRVLYELEGGSLQPGFGLPTLPEGNGSGSVAATDLGYVPAAPVAGSGSGACAVAAAAAVPPPAPPLNGRTRGAQSMPSMALDGRPQGAPSPLLPSVPYTPLVAASTPPPLSRGGALAAAMAAAKAATVGSMAPPLPPRVALVFSGVHDAVCFCVHMQAMLTNCRWPLEILELPGCQPIGVRPRAVGADQGTGGGGPGGGGKAAGKAATAAGSGGGESGGGVVGASAQSSFIVASQSPFTASGAVDRMKSLISGGVKGRSGKLLKPLPMSPRLANIVSASAVLEPERSAYSVSRFANAFPVTASASAVAAATPAFAMQPAVMPPHFATQSLSPYRIAAATAAAAARGGDPWVCGPLGYAGGGGTSSASPTAWGAVPQTSGFTVAAQPGSPAAAMGLYGSLHSGSPALRSPLGFSRASRNGSPAAAAAVGPPGTYGSYTGAPYGAASLPLPRSMALRAAAAAAMVAPLGIQHTDGGARVPSAAAAARIAGQVSVQPYKGSCASPAAAHGSGPRPEEAEGDAAGAKGAGGGHHARSTFDQDQTPYNPAHDGALLNTAAAMAATAGAGAVDSGDSGLAQGSERDVTGIVIDDLYIDGDGPLRHTLHDGGVGDDADAGLAQGSWAPAYARTLTCAGSSGDARRAYPCGLTAPLPPTFGGGASLATPEIDRVSVTPVGTVAALVQSSSHMSYQAITATQLQMAAPNYGDSYNGDARTLAPIGPRERPLESTAGAEPGTLAFLSLRPSATVVTVSQPGTTTSYGTLLYGNGGASDAGVGRQSAVLAKRAAAASGVPEYDGAGEEWASAHAAADRGMPGPVAEGMEAERTDNDGGDTDRQFATEVMPMPATAVAEAAVVGIGPIAAAARGSAGSGSSQPALGAAHQHPASLAQVLTRSLYRTAEQYAQQRPVVGTSPLVAPAPVAAPVVDHLPPAQPTGSHPLTVSEGDHRIPDQLHTASALPPAPLRFPASCPPPLTSGPGSQPPPSPPHGSPRPAPQWPSYPKDGLTSPFTTGAVVGGRQLQSQYQTQPQHQHQPMAGDGIPAMSPPPPPLGNFVHHSMPLHVADLSSPDGEFGAFAGGSGRAAAFGTLSTNLYRLPRLRRSSTNPVAQSGDRQAPDAATANATAAANAAAAANTTATANATVAPCSDGPGGPSAAGGLHGVRSFGEQVRLTFEALEGASRLCGEEDLTVIFRGPRVVCGISMWQYGDDEGEQHNGRRDALDGNEFMMMGLGFESPTSPAPAAAEGGVPSVMSNAKDTAYGATSEGGPTLRAGLEATTAAAAAGVTNAHQSVFVYQGEEPSGPGGISFYPTAHSNPLYTAAAQGLNPTATTGAASAATGPVHGALFTERLSDRALFERIDNEVIVGFTPPGDFPPLAPLPPLPEQQQLQLQQQQQPTATGGSCSHALAGSSAQLPQSPSAGAFPYIGGTGAVGSSEPLHSRMLTSNGARPLIASDGGGGHWPAVSPATVRWQRRRLPAPLRRALAICESGQGGFVLLDGATYSSSSTSQEALQEQCMILHMGDYLLPGLQSSQDLYLALDFAHLARLGYLQPLCCTQQLSLGLLSAPVNAASICFTLVVGMQTLLAWNSDVAKVALGVLRDAALPALLEHGGYLVEDADGLLLTAFPSSRSALAWALQCQEEAKHLDWPSELLAHALGEAVCVDDDVATGSGSEIQSDDDDGPSTAAAHAVGRPSPQQGEAQGQDDVPPCGGGGGNDSGGGDGGGGGGRGGAGGSEVAAGLRSGGALPALGLGNPSNRGGARRHLVFRGLRIKSGLDCGDVLARVHTTTGRMTYRGRVMNRAARIAGLATAGQVLCSRGLWDNSGLEASPDLCPEALAFGESLGAIQLKGLSAKMEVINCIRVLRSEVVEAHLKGPMVYPQFAGSYLPNLATFPGGGIGLETGGAAATVGSSDAGEGATGVEAALAVGRPHALGLPPLAPVLMQAVPLLSDSEDEDASDAGRVGVGASGGGGTAGANAVGTESSVFIDGGDRNSFGHAAASIPLATAAAVGRVSLMSRDSRLDIAPPAAVAAEDMDGPTGAGVARKSVQRPSAASRVPYDRTSVSSATSGNAALAAAVAKARIRRASAMQITLLHSKSMVLTDRAGASGAALAAAAAAAVAAARHGTSGAIIAAAVEEDDIADRLVAEYSSGGDSGVDVDEGASDGGSSGGSQQQEAAVERPSLHLDNSPTSGVAALHGMLRRQRPAGGTTGAPRSSGIAAQIAAAGGSAGGASVPSNPAPVGNLATAAAANIKKALRGLRRSILDDSGGSGSAGGSGSESEAPLAGPGRAGPNGAKLHRGSEIVRPVGAAAAAAGASGTTGVQSSGGGGGRLFDRLRSLAAHGGRGGGLFKGRGGGDLYDNLYGMDGDPGRLRPMASANSEFFPSRSASPMLSAARARLRGGGLSSSIKRSNSNLAGGGGGGSQLLGSPFAGGAQSTSPVGHAASSSRVVLAGTGGALNRSNSRLGGGGSADRGSAHGLVAEMSLASMTMRRHIPVSQLLGTAATAGMSRSFCQRALGSDNEDDVGTQQQRKREQQATTTRWLTPARPSAAPREGPEAAEPSQPEGPAGAPKEVDGGGGGHWLLRKRPTRKGSRSYVRTAMAFDILEDDGAEDGNDTEDPEVGGASTAQPGSERVSSMARNSGATAPSLPSRLASFTTSFLHRARSRRQQPTTAPPLGAAEGNLLRSGSAELTAAEAVDSAATALRSSVPRRRSMDEQQQSQGRRLPSRTVSFRRSAEAVEADGGGGGSSAIRRASGTMFSFFTAAGSCHIAGGGGGGSMMTGTVPAASPGNPLTGSSFRPDAAGSTSPTASYASGGYQQHPHQQPHLQRQQQFALQHSSSMGHGLTLGPPLLKMPSRRLAARSGSGRHTNVTVGGRSSSSSGIAPAAPALALSNPAAAGQEAPPATAAGGGPGEASGFEPPAGYVAGSSAIAGSGGGVGVRAGLLSSMHNLLGLVPGGSGAGGSGAGALSPRGSGGVHSIAPSAGSGILSGGGGTGGAGGGGSVGRAGRRRSQRTAMEELVSAEYGGGGAGGGSSRSVSHNATPTARQQRRRSVIEVSGNVMILNAGSSYAAGGWLLDMDSEPGGGGGSSILGDAFDSTNANRFDPGPDILPEALSGQLLRPAIAPVSDAPTALPRRRRSQRLLLPGNATGAEIDGSGSKTLTESSEARRSPRRRLSRGVRSMLSGRLSGGLPLAAAPLASVPDSQGACSRIPSQFDVAVSGGGGAGAGAGAAASTVGIASEPAGGLPQGVSGGQRFAGSDAVSVASPGVVGSGSMPYGASTGSGGARKSGPEPSPSSAAFVVSAAARASAGVSTVRASRGSSDGSTAAAAASPLSAGRPWPPALPPSLLKPSGSATPPTAAAAAAAAGKADVAAFSGSSGDHDVLRPSTSAGAGHRRLVPELAKPARHLVSRVVGTRKARSGSGGGGAASDGGGGALPSSSDDGGGGSRAAGRACGPERALSSEVVAASEEEAGAEWRLQSRQR